MNHSIYNLYPAIKLSSGINIHLQSISLSHTYIGLQCGTPNEKMNDNIIAETRKKFEEACFIVKPKVTMLSEYDFFDKGDHYSKENTIPLLAAVKVEALFECYDGDECTNLLIVWFQNDFLTAIPRDIKNDIQDIDWYCYACEFSV